MFKKLAIGGGLFACVAVAAVIAIVVYVASNLDSIVKKAIETLGPSMTGVPVTVQKVGIKLTDGSAEIGKLVIGNPSGYKEPHAFSLGIVRLAIDPATVTGNVITIREITIDAPEMTFEKTLTDSNLEAIKRNIDEFIKKNIGTSPAAPAPEKKADASAEKRFIVNSLQVRGVKVRVAGAGRAAQFTLPTISLADIGKSRGGVTGAEMASVILKEMIEATLKAAAQELAEEGVKRVTDEAKKKIKDEVKLPGGLNKLIK